MGDFLRKRRAALSPADVGLMDYGTRRVPGLRREEVAMLAGMSVTYYARLEQGQHVNASDAIINSLAQALARPRSKGNTSPTSPASNAAYPRPLGTGPTRCGPGRNACRFHGQRSVGSAGQTHRSPGWNRAGHWLVASHLDFGAPGTPSQRPNMTRMLFLDEATRSLYPHWRSEAARAVASLRLLSGRFADDTELASLVGELTLKSPEFATMWAEHPVENCMSGHKTLDHPSLGAWSSYSRS